MRNWELKARCPDADAVPARVSALDGRYLATLAQRDTYFHVVHGRLKLREITPDDGAPSAELIQYDRANRAEARGSNYVIAPVPDADALRIALTRALGVRAVVTKTRRLYLWRSTRIHLDRVDGLGAFLELETVITDQSDAEAAAELAAAATALGVRDEDRLSLSYVDLVESSPP
jgi:predicted adenylyl cyclase CyaB